MRLAIFGVFTLIIATCVLTACNSQDVLVAQNPKVPGASPQTPQTPPDNARRITAAELHDLWEKDKVLVIDTRNEASYKESHIKGAILVPSTEFPDRADELPRDKMIVAYCT